ncbi:hypothetical protein EGR_07586 [Echinococcus granulosus]|uniref:Uncharacterized protein n=1 Tax=Echinococcus granulosus TaxID=6210 RepID=W6U988_ECHGR|nr:hypothetical protein EGR_07586 [Echinococcus granulosus]EUB57575.1 hypothetical protein EGR_07586 [Echinococcus granulosus]
MGQSPEAPCLDMLMGVSKLQLLFSTLDWTGDKSGHTRGGADIHSFAESSCPQGGVNCFRQSPWSLVQLHESRGLIKPTHQAAAGSGQPPKPPPPPPSSP